MFPHTVTVYVTLHETDLTTMKDVEKHYITVLKGVLLVASKAKNVNESGLEGADAVNLYIPLSVDARDGKTGITQKYTGSVEWWRTADKSALWTLSKTGNCFFVKGEHVHYDLPVQTIKAMYDDVYNVTKIDLLDFGGDMAHLEAGGA